MYCKKWGYTVPPLPELGGPVNPLTPQLTCPPNLGHFQVGSYRYRSPIEGLYTI